MYNRYIPQPDGSYRRNRVPDQRPSVQPQKRVSPKKQDFPPQPPVQVPPPRHTSAENKQNIPPSRQEQSITGFLKQILPKDLDTGDLLIILLLLLMAGDCAEDQNTAMLTLAMYLFM